MHLQAVARPALAVEGRVGENPAVAASRWSEAAAVVGATWLQIIRRIVLPILLPGLIAAWSFVFVLSLKELNTSILLVTPSSNVLSTLIYDVYQEGSFATLSALVLIQAVMAAVALALLDSVAARISTSNNKTADSGPALGA